MDNLDSTAHSITALFRRGEVYKLGWTCGFYGCPVKRFHEGYSANETALSEFVDGYQHGFIEHIRRVELNEN
jgi:hypothetical protein